MGPNDIKKDIYKVMTKSRDLTNYCQESIKSFKSKKISDSLNNFHLKNSKDFITLSLTGVDPSFIDLNHSNLDNPLESENNAIYNKVIEFIEDYLKN